LRTVLHHLKSPWQHDHQSSAQSNTRYYFCDDLNCPVIYFCDDNRTLYQSQLRTEVGIKSSAPQRTLCYCFGVNAAQAEADPKIRHFVTDQTQNRNCACDIRNPSGRCCLNTFPKQAKQ
jgi:hypothetical protein